MIAPLRRRVVVFAGGGTGGHLFPAVAVARALPSIEAVFVVPHDRGDEQRLRGEFRCVPQVCPRADRARLLFPARLARSIRRARRLLRELEASAAVGLGGYASLPATVAARTLGLPVYLMECNAVPGRATRWLSRLAAGVGLGDPRALEALPVRGRCRVTGTPLRDELRLAPADGAERLGLSSVRPTLLVLGGSQGARGLNSRVLDALPALRDLEFQVLHCTGEADRARVAAAYAACGVRAHVADFLPDIGAAYAVADLVLARAGASTVAECLALGRPAAFVPYPWHRDRQQVLNAELAVRAGAARLIEESALTPSALRALVRGVLLEPSKLAAMARAAAALGRPDAAGAMAAHMVETLGDAVAEPSWKVELGG